MSNLLNNPNYIKSFTARGEIDVKGSQLSYDIQNGIASFRFIKRKGLINLDVVKELDGKWTSFEDYKNNEYEHIDNDLKTYYGFDAYLYYGYMKDNSICFYVKYIINKHTEITKINKIGVFASCLTNHFYEPLSFDFNTNGFIEEEPCTTFMLDEKYIKVYKQVGVCYNRKDSSLKYKFPKEIIGGFLFESDNGFDVKLVSKIVNAVNKYCQFILCSSGNFIGNVYLLNNDNPEFYENFYYIENDEKFETEFLFKFDDVESAFGEFLKEIIVDDVNFSELYSYDKNVLSKIDILRVASMFENQYRKNVDAGLCDYVKKEEEYKTAYLKVVQLNEPTNELESRIKKDQIQSRNHLTSSLRARLRFVFDKLLKCIGTSQQQINQSFGTRFIGYNMSDLANRITSARNDIAHLLEGEIDYKTTIWDVLILQKMIYFMILERYKLKDDTIKKILLSNSKRLNQMFGIDK